MYLYLSLHTDVLFHFYVWCHFFTLCVTFTSPYFDLNEQGIIPSKSHGMPYFDLNEQGIIPSKSHGMWSFEIAVCLTMQMYQFRYLNSEKKKNQILTVCWKLLILFVSYNKNKCENSKSRSVRILIAMYSKYIVILSSNSIYWKLNDITSYMYKKTENRLYHLHISRPFVVHSGQVKLLCWLHCC